jgi:hypothetical protein
MQSLFSRHSNGNSMSINRRHFSQLALGGFLCAGPLPLSVGAFAKPDPLASLAGVVGITVGGGIGEQKERGELSLLDLPRYVRNDLGMQLIDLNTRWFDNYDERLLDELREAAERQGCFFTNLKVNRSFDELYSEDNFQRQAAMQEARQLIQAAHTLGTRWIRFTIPQTAASNPTSHRELADISQDHGIQLLVENSGWLMQVPTAMTDIVTAIGRNVASCPDTGNWSSPEFREAGLRSSFPHAASCDFKVFELGANHSHEPYDLKECFDIGWQAGFRGPWVIEHMQTSRERFAKDTLAIRDMLLGWIATA